jgi:hypothetical protein
MCYTASIYHSFNIPILISSQFRYKSSQQSLTDMYDTSDCGLFVPTALSKVLNRTLTRTIKLPGMHTNHTPPAISFASSRRSTCTTRTSAQIADPSSVINIYGTPGERPMG